MMTAAAAARRRKTSLSTVPAVDWTDTVRSPGTSDHVLLASEPDTVTVRLADERDTVPAVGTAGPQSAAAPDAVTTLGVNTAGLRSPIEPDTVRMAAAAQDTVPYTALSPMLARLRTADTTSTVHHRRTTRWPPRSTASLSAIAMDATEYTASQISPGSLATHCVTFSVPSN